jgi:ribose 5-phosphate isomerase B
MKIGLASDHAGYRLKETLKDFLNQYECVDFGTNSEESCNYPDFAHALANAVQNNEVDLGISICGSGNGIQMAVNKHKGVRAALCWDIELAELAKQHNNANVCSLPARFISEEKALKIVDAFLNTDFEGGRHIKRVEDIDIK